MVDEVGAATVWSAAAWSALPRACSGPCGGCRAHEDGRTRLGRGQAVIQLSGPRRMAMLAASDPCVVQWVVCITAAMVEDTWRLYTYVRDEMRAYSVHMRMRLRRCRSDERDSNLDLDSLS